jgi:hypothetical protein
MSIDLEYAIRQDIRNNPVVREVDREQKREFYRLLLWAGAVVVMLLIAVVPRFTAVSTGYRAEELRDELAAEQARYRLYLLELEVRTRPQHIRDRATRELGMVAPTESDTLVLERVPPASRPSRAVVAHVR